MNGVQVKEPREWGGGSHKVGGGHSLALLQSYLFSLRGEKSGNKTQENERGRRRGGGQGRNTMRVGKRGKRKEVSFSMHEGSQKNMN